MSELVTVKVQGLDSLLAQIEELGVETGVKVLASAARRAFKPVIDAARAMVPIQSGALRAAIRLSSKKPNSGDSVIVVGLKIAGGASSVLIGGASRSELPAPRRWHWIELGTAHMAAHPFIRPALDQNTSAVLEQLKVEIQKSIDRAIRRKAKK